MDGSQPRSQKDSTRPPARPALTTASALRCLSARFSEQTADLPVPAGIFLNISGNIHTVQKSPRDCFKTRNLLAAAVDEDIHPVDHRSVKALNQEGGRLALRASVRGRGPRGRRTGRGDRHGAYLAAAWRRSVSPAGRWKSLSGCRTSVTPAVAALLLLVVFVERVKRKDIDKYGRERA